jgi:hypothetical protein
MAAQGSAFNLGKPQLRLQAGALTMFRSSCTYFQSSLQIAVTLSLTFTDQRNNQTISANEPTAFLPGSLNLCSLPYPSHISHTSFPLKYSTETWPEMTAPGFSSFTHGANWHHFNVSVEIVVAGSSKIDWLSS